MPWQHLRCLPAVRTERSSSPLEDAVLAIPPTLLDLVAEASGMSRTKVRDSVAHGLVLVNGEPCYDPDYRAGEADEVELLARAPS